ncbi:MAG: hypothetical protein PHT92_11125 [Bacteroidales bacterium]|jgi:hypothetical protein|nr:hypothetical protein [Bacteroidales bacterium]
MKEDLNQLLEEPNSEFDQWLKAELISEQVEAPCNLSSIVMEQLMEETPRKQIDPYLIISLLAIVVGGSLVIVASYLPNTSSLEFTQFLLTVASKINTQATVYGVLGATILCSIFFGLDYLMSRKIGERNLSVR